MRLPDTTVDMFARLLLQLSLSEHVLKPSNHTLHRLQVIDHGVYQLVLVNHTRKLGREILAL